MGEKQVLQRGNRVTIDSKGKRTSRPLEDGEVAEQIAANKRMFGAELADNAAAATVGKMQKMPNRRDVPIDAAYAKGGSVKSRGDGAATRGKTRGKMC